MIDLALEQSVLPEPDGPFMGQCHRQETTRQSCRASKPPQRVQVS